MQTNVNIRKIDNGYLVEWYTPADTSANSTPLVMSGTSSCFSFSTIEEALTKVREVLN